MIGKHCSGQTLATVFVNDLGKDLNTAKEECVEACDIRDDCKFANLYKGESCYLQATCSEMDDFFEYRVYIKQWFDSFVTHWFEKCQWRLVYL